jgi:hypothetical protein
MYDIAQSRMERRHVHSSADAGGIAVNRMVWEAFNRARRS